MLASSNRRTAAPIRNDGLAILHAWPGLLPAAMAPSHPSSQLLPAAWQLLPTALPLLPDDLCLPHLSTALLPAARHALLQALGVLPAHVMLLPGEPSILDPSQSGNGTLRCRRGSAQRNDRTRLRGTPVQDPVATFSDPGTVSSPVTRTLSTQGLALGATVVSSPGQVVGRRLEPARITIDARESSGPAHEPMPFDSGGPEGATRR